MPLKDDTFSGANKPKEYLDIIEELQEKQETDATTVAYDFDIEEEEEE